MKLGRLAGFVRELDWRDRSGLTAPGRQSVKRPSMLERGDRLGELIDKDRRAAGVTEDGWIPLGRVDP